ncbi:MAG: diguanylate cyclase [Gammaproteobacteria bacterium]|nr:MAG: diguanylate cyclase [Gammaproteobacteria bacterium]
MVQTILSTVVERDETILSAALRRRGNTLAVAGPHEEFWEPPEDGRSSPTHVQIPVMNGENQWGLIELRFRALQSVAGLRAWRDSPLALFAFIGLAGFAVYFLFLRRALRELDPSSVVPEHVRSAFNALAEGVIIIDEEERIVLANQEFANMMEREADSLIGLKASELDWFSSQSSKSSESSESSESNIQYPWQQAMSKGKSHMGSRLRRQSSKDGARIFVVNGAPILDAKGNTRGALATFDDISDIEQKNEELEDAMMHLSESREAIERKNKELQYLATRDPLTNLLNRRALFELFEQRFENAKRDSLPLVGLMIDIDEFKSVNDRYGHSVGDEVIQFVGEKLMSAAKFGDLSGRYGGEEFCLILPGSSIDDALALAERLRITVRTDFRAQFSLDIDLTISLGVASLEGAEDTASDLLNRADKALYAAKAHGRNRVVTWGDPELDTAAAVAAEERSIARHTSNAVLVRETMSVKAGR